MSNLLLKSAVPMSPYHQVEVIASVNEQHSITTGSGIEELVDTKVIGQYLGVCRVIKRSSYTTPDHTSVVKPGDLILVWDTAIKPFELPNGLGHIDLVKDADIFMRVPKSDVTDDLLKSLERE